MLVELGTNSQITIPKEMPVVVYPKAYVVSIKSEIEKVKRNISQGKQPVCDSIDMLLDDLED